MIVVSNVRVYTLLKSKNIETERREYAQINNINLLLAAPAATATVAALATAKQKARKQTKKRKKFRLVRTNKNYSRKKK